MTRNQKKNKNKQSEICVIELNQESRKKPTRFDVCMYHIDVIKILYIYKREDHIGMLRMHVLCPLSSSAQLVS